MAEDAKSLNPLLSEAWMLREEGYRGGNVTYWQSQSSAERGMDAAQEMASARRKLTVVSILC